MTHMRTNRLPRTSGLRVAALVLSTLCAAQGQAADAASDLAAHAQTCLHYENRARFQARGPDASLEARVADTCRTALGMARLGPAAPGAALDVPAEVREARRYLDRLTRLRLEIAALNSLRLYGADAGRLAQPGARPPARLDRRFGMVTRTGEYLIARHLGVIDALRRWNDATLDLAER